MSQRLVIVGPPGAGKGTQAARLAAALGIPAISTGDIFRTNIAEGTELGVLARQYTDAGQLVPDDVTNAMVRERLGRADCAAGFLLDGYPRNVAQVEELAEILAGYGTALDGVIELRVDDATLVDRLLHRAEVEGRADDTAEVIERRLALYHELTAPVVAAYAVKDMVASVDGLGEVDEVTDRMLRAVADSL